jgi:transposase InsO family protein
MRSFLNRRARRLALITVALPAAAWALEQAAQRAETRDPNSSTSLTLAQVVVEAWRIEYNTYRPHSALDGLTPAEYAATWTSTTQPTLS